MKLVFSPAPTLSSLSWLKQFIWTANTFPSDTTTFVYTVTGVYTGIGTEYWDVYAYYISTTNYGNP